MNGARQLKIIETIRKLIEHNMQYIDYRDKNKNFSIFMVYNYYYAIMKRLHPKAQVWNLENSYSTALNITLSYRKNKYRLSKEDKRCILMAINSFNKIEYNKPLVENIIKNLFKLRAFY